jgi:GNAT superfamily N-acetyltransferase
MKLGVDYITRPLFKNDDVKNFKMGDNAFQPLKSFLQNHAVKFQTASIAQTYVAIPLESGLMTNKVIGFITLTCSEIDLKNGYKLEDCEFANKYDSLPAVKIARLAVDSRHRKQGIGERLVDLAIIIAIEQIAPQIGCRFLIADAKPQAVKFYERCGFTLLDTAKNRKSDHPVMFIDLNNY